MKTGVRLDLHNGLWVATEAEPQGKDTYVRVLGWYPDLEMAKRDFPDAEVHEDEHVR